MVTIDEIESVFRPILSRSNAERAILFGSYTRGESDSYSDIDLVIVANTERAFVERFRDFQDILDVSPAAVEMLVYTPHEFERMVQDENPLILRVLKEGRLIYERSGR